MGHGWKYEQAQAEKWISHTQFSLNPGFFYAGGFL